MFEFRKQIFSTCAVSPLLVGALLAFFTMETVGPAQAGPNGPQVAHINSTPGGQTYGRWAAEWWQWAVGVPPATNPLLDATGANCAERQVDDTWFLAGSFIGPVERNCTVPPGKALFFPLINIAFFAFLNDPPEQQTEAFVRENGSCTEPAVLSANIDGKPIGNLQRFTTGVSGSQSPLFNVQMPPDNLFGARTGGAFGRGSQPIPELVLSPSAEEGFYLYVEPLAPGDHTIEWLATGCTEGNEQNITYNLTIPEPTS